MSRNSGPILKQNKMSYDFDLLMECKKKLSWSLAVGKIPLPWYRHHNTVCVCREENILTATWQSLKSIYIAKMMYMTFILCSDQPINKHERLSFLFIYEVVSK